MLMLMKRVMVKARDKERESVAYATARYIPFSKFWPNLDQELGGDRKHRCVRFQIRLWL